MIQVQPEGLSLESLDVNEPFFVKEVAGEIELGSIIAPLDR